MKTMVINTLLTTVTSVHPPPLIIMIIKCATEFDPMPCPLFGHSKSPIWLCLGLWVGESDCGTKQTAEYQM